MFGVIISIMAATTTFLCGNKKFGLRAGFRPPFSGSFEVGIVRIAKSSQVLSLEVAEHIPRQFESSFLQNLDRLIVAGERW